MVRWLVWTCGGFVAVGVLIRLFWAWAGKLGIPPPPLAGSGPVSSTPPAAIVVDPRVQFELNIQKSLIRDGVLSRPPQDAPADILRAFDLALEAKTAEATDVQAAREAAGRVWEEKKAKHDLDRKDRKAKADEKMKSEREKNDARRAQHRAEMSPEDLQRRQGRVRPDPIPLPPPFIEDPANPVPKPPEKAPPAPEKR